MKLNKIEPRTTNNFKINDIDLDINIPSIDSFKAYNIISDEYDKLKVNINTIDKELTNRKSKRENPKKTIEMLEREMKEAAKMLDFERAMEIRDAIFEIKVNM